MNSVALPRNFAVAAGIFGAVVMGEMAGASPLEKAVDTSGVSGFIGLSYGDHTINSGLADVVEVDSYRFQARAGDSVRAVISSLSAGLDPEIALRDPAGMVLQTVSCNGGSISRCSVNLDQALTATGTYTLNISDTNSDETGDYSFHLDQYPPADNWVGAAYDSPVLEELGHQSDLDFFAFNGNAGTGVRVTTRSLAAGLDPNLQIWDPAGNLISDTSCNGGSISRCTTSVDLELSLTGTYTLGLADTGWNETGDYDLGVSCLFGECPTAVPTPPPIASQQDVIVDFRDIGLWARMNDASWLKLNNSSADWLVTADMDGNGKDDVVADFGSTLGGIFVKRNLGVWSKLHNFGSELLAAGNLDGNGKDEVIIDFGGIGLWARMNDASWLKLANTTPALVVAGDLDGNGADDVIAVFDSGVFVKRNLGGWAQLHNLVPELLAVGDLDNSGRDDLVVDFGGIGLWARMNDSSWLKLHNGSPELIQTGDLDGNGADDLLASFAGFGLWQKLNLGGWSKLSNNAPDVLVTADVTGNGQDDIVAGFGSSVGGIFIRRDQGAWAKWHNTPAEGLAAGDLDTQ